MTDQAKAMIHAQPLSVLTSVQSVKKQQRPGVDAQGPYSEFAGLHSAEGVFLYFENLVLHTDLRYNAKYNACTIHSFTSP